MSKQRHRNTDVVDCSNYGQLSLKGFSRDAHPRHLIKSTCVKASDRITTWVELSMHPGAAGTRFAPAWYRAVCPCKRSPPAGCILLWLQPQPHPIISLQLKTASAGFGLKTKRRANNRSLRMREKCFRNTAHRIGCLTMLDTITTLILNRSGSKH